MVGLGFGPDRRDGDLGHVVSGARWLQSEPLHPESVGVADRDDDMAVSTALRLRVAQRERFEGLLAIDLDAPSGQHRLDAVVAGEVSGSDGDEGGAGTGQ